MTEAPLSQDEQIAFKIIEKFVARPDVKAEQMPVTTRFPGGYQPVKHINGIDYLEWELQDLLDHLAGTRTYGHYLLDRDNTCKVFAFDIDLNKTGYLPTLPYPSADAGEEEALEWFDSFRMCDDMIAAWHDRSNPARDYLKFAMRSYAQTLQIAIQDLEIPSLVAYSGNKGIHVYGFPGRMPAADVRAGARIVIEGLPMVPTRGENFFTWQGDTREELKLFTVEVFPKQDTISNEGGFGNLMRLPLGVNVKSEDPTFFVDTDAPMGVLRPVDALTALSF